MDRHNNMPSSLVFSVHYRCYCTEFVMIDEKYIVYIKRLEFVRYPMRVKMINDMGGISMMR